MQYKLRKAKSNRAQWVEINFPPELSHLAGRVFEVTMDEEGVHYRLLPENHPPAIPNWASRTRQLRSLTCR